MDGNTLIICGQTGTGKTSLALQLAELYNGELISADSRQIYRDMDIGTGKVNEKSELTSTAQGTFIKNQLIHGINLVNPDQYYNAAQFKLDAEVEMQKIKEKNKKIIIVGGTGFYLKTLFFPDDTVNIPQNEALRTHYEDLQKRQNKQTFVFLLQQKLQQIDPERLKSMNNSDKLNSRRLIRAIEVGEYNQNNVPIKTNQSTHIKQTWIGLFASKELLKEQITTRVENMIENGLEQEVRALVQTYSWSANGLQTMGYIEWKEYLEGKESLEQVKEKIIQSHMQYARKQLIYFKRFPFIQWIDTSSNSWKQKIIPLLSSSLNW